MARQQKYYYEDGSAARNLEHSLPTRETYFEEIIREHQRHIRERKREHSFVIHLNKVYTVYFAIGLLITGVFFVSYVHLQNSITTSMNNIARLEQNIATLKEDNSATASRISTATNLTHVKQVAMNELGMVYATNDQIVYYEVETEDFMDSYE